MCRFKFYFQKVFLSYNFEYYVHFIILFCFFRDYNYMLDLLCLCISTFSDPSYCCLGFIFIFLAVLIPFLNISYYILSKISSPWTCYSLVFFPEMICIFPQFLMILTNSCLTSFWLFVHFCSELFFWFPVFFYITKWLFKVFTFRLECCVSFFLFHG